MSLWRQGWLSVAVWMSFGLLLEGLAATKAPAYLQDPVRREMFRLAHSHGNLLGLLLLGAALGRKVMGLELPARAEKSLRVGAVLLPLGFLLGGVAHPEGDPGIGVFLAPIGALLAIYGVISATLASRR